MAILEYKVSFVIPVLNEEKLIKGCLKRIREQNYNQSLIRIMIFDAGCTDETIEIAKRYNAEIYFNVNKKPEFAHKIASVKSDDDIFIIFAADNYINDKLWLTKMLKPFEKENICGAFSEIGIFDKDTSKTNLFYSYLTLEPFTWYVYGNNYCIQRKFKKVFKPININLSTYNDYEIYKFSINKHPLIALAQGFAIRKDVFQKITLGDDIVPFLELINLREKFAFVKNTNIYHLHIRSFSDFNNKYKSRILNNLNKTKSGITHRNQYLSKIRKLKMYLFIFYALTLIGPIYDSIRFYYDHKKTYVFMHLPCSIIIAYQIIIQSFLFKIKK